MGDPAHSWRVLWRMLLMEGDFLSKEYRFDEPWNSLHNKTLAAGLPIGMSGIYPESLRVPRHGFG